MAKRVAAQNTFTSYQHMDRTRRDFKPLAFDVLGGTGFKTHPPTQYLNILALGDQDPFCPADLIFLGAQLTFDG